MSRFEKEEGSDIDKAIGDMIDRSIASPGVTITLKKEGYQ